MSPPRAEGHPRTPGHTSSPPARVLVVDDEPAIRRGLARALLGHGFAVDTAEGGRAALDLLRTRPVDVVLLDHAMPDMEGLSVLALLRQEHPDVEVVLLAALGDEGAASAAIQGGAYAVVTKPLSAPEAAILPVERAAERRRLLDQKRALEQKLSSHEQLGEIIGTSSRMTDLVRRAASAATTMSPVLVLGERGTGRGLFARMVHRRSNRARDPLHVVSPTELPPERAEGEITGAIELALGGTLILEEVGDLPRDAQASLARALGGGDGKRADVRLIATGSPDLRARVEEGSFQEDLYYRLGVILLEIPPLRRRRDDIPLLAYHFLRRHAARAGRPIGRIGVEALKRLRAHPWPGNVRELEAVIEHAVVMARSDVIVPADLPIGQPDALDDDGRGEPRAGVTLAGSEALDQPYAEAKDRAVGAFDRAYVEQMLERTGGNVSEAARLAAMDRSNFRRLMKKVRRASVPRQ
jgi:DNA-binding NtrC family response regulator